MGTCFFLPFSRIRTSKVPFRGRGPPRTPLTYPGLMTTVTFFGNAFDSFAARVLNAFHDRQASISTVVPFFEEIFFPPLLMLGFLAVGFLLLVDFFFTMWYDELRRRTYEEHDVYYVLDPMNLLRCCFLGGTEKIKKSEEIKNRKVFIFSQNTHLHCTKKFRPSITNHKKKLR